MSRPTLVPPNLMEEFWSECSVESRRWLRCEMESFLDPMLDDLFARLGTKFVDYANKKLNSEKEYIQDDTQNTILNTSLHNPTRSVPILNSYSTPDQFPNRNISENVFGPRVVIKEEIEPTTDNSTNNNESNLSTLFPNSNDEKLLFHDDQEEDCDCDDCTNGVMDFKVEEDIDEEGEWIVDIEDNNPEEGTSKPTKRQRSDDEAQLANSPNEQSVFITINLKCLQPNCVQTFTTKEQLDYHLMHGHSIRRFPCLVRNCIESFDNTHAMGQHLRVCHSHLTKWPCQQCSTQSGSYNLLSIHTTRFHQLGQFQCSFPNCPFIAQYKSKVYAHFAKQHKQELVCQFPGCGHRSRHSTQLKAHERDHLGIKPFRCRWPSCGFADASRNNTLQHIRTVHLRGSHQNERFQANTDPKVYLEVVKDLL